MKAYTFIHKYVCGIQVGIQAGHSLVKLMSSTNKGNIILDNKVQEWADYHKTFVWLDGGDSDSMLSIVDTLSSLDMPFVCFNETAMRCTNYSGGMLTAITVILSSEQVKLCNRVGDENLPLMTFNDGTETYFIEEPLMKPDITRLLNLVANSRTKSI